MTGTAKHIRIHPLLRSTLRLVVFLGIGLSIFITGGCTKLNVGHDFPDEKVPNIQMGITTKEEIRAVFGEPWRVGLENGLETWTYGSYRYSGFRETSAKDLVVRFTKSDVVESYTFSTTNR